MKNRLLFYMRFIAQLALVVFFISACIKPADQETSADLLSVAVNHPQPLPFAAFNQRLIDATASKAEWANDPVLLIHTFFGASSGRTLVLTINKIGGPENIHKAILIVDGSDDDSIRGYRYDIKLGKNTQEIWQILEAGKSWRCWKERGHTDFSAENCS